MTDSRIKQVIVVRKDLSMSVGKLASQACHACLEASEKAKNRDYVTWGTWRKRGAKKVVVGVDSLEELLELECRAEELDIPCVLILDKGLTQIPPNTPTALGLGPWREHVIDRVTSRLKLL